MRFIGGFEVRKVVDDNFYQKRRKNCPLFSNFFFIVGPRVTTEVYRSGSTIKTKSNLWLERFDSQKILTLSVTQFINWTNRDSLMMIDVFFLLNDKQFTPLFPRFKDCCLNLILLWLIIQTWTSRYSLDEFSLFTHKF